MKNITVSIDEHTHRQARIRAAELGMSVSGLVRTYLNRLVAESIETPVSNVQDPEIPLERQQRLKEFFEGFDARGRGISEIIPREAIYDHNAPR